MANSDLGSIIAHLKLDMKDYTNNLNVAKNDIEETVKQFDGLSAAGDAVAGVGKKLTMGITLPVAALGASSVKTGMEFDAAMSKVAGLSGATGAELQKLEDTAKQMGATTIYSATEAADALGYMALAGWDVNESTSALPGVLNLAAASGMDLAKASDLCTDYMSAFGMEASEAGRMADVLAYAQANSNTTTEQLGEAFKNCAVNANAFGLDVEQTTAVLGKLADQGLKGSEAGTALNAVFRDMSSKMKNGAIEIGKVKVNITNANGEFRNMSDIVADVNKATDGLSDSEKMVALQSTFTADSIKAMGIMTNTGSDAIAQFTDELYSAEGAAKTMADTMNNNLKGDLAALSSAFESVKLVISDTLTAAIRPMIQGLTKLMQWIASLPEPVQKFVIALLGILAVAGPVLLAVGKMMKAYKEFKETLLWFQTAGSIFNGLKGASGIVGVLKGAFTSFSGVITGTVIPALKVLWGVLMANPIILIIAAIVALVAGFIYLWNNCEAFREFWINLWNTCKQAWDDFCNWVIETAQAFPGYMQAIQDWFANLPNAIAYWLGFAAGKIVQWCGDTLQAFIDWAIQVVENVSNWFSELPGRIWQWLVDTYNKCVQWGRDTKQSMKDAARNAINGVIDWFSKLPGRVWNWLVNAYNKAVQWGNNMKSEMKTKAEQTVTNITDAFTDLPSKLWSIGTDALNGLWGGMKSVWNNISSWVSEKAAAIKQGFKDALDINSPSRVMRDEVGKWIPEGIRVGIQANSKPLMDTLSALSSSISTSINPDLTSSLKINTNNSIRLTDNPLIAQMKSLELAMKEHNIIDYGKLQDAFTAGAANVDSSIYMDETLVGKKTARTVKEANDIVKKRLNRLEGVTE